MHPSDPWAVSGRFEPAHEAAYQADLAGEKVRVFYRTSLLSSVLFLCFGLLDLIQLTSNVGTAWAVRGCVVLATVAAALAARYRPEAFLRHYKLVTGLTYFGWGLGIDAMILLADPADLAWNSFYAGLILVSMALYTWTYLRPLEAGAVGSLVALVYMVLAVSVMGEHDGWTVLLGNCLCLVCANVGGVLSLSMRERFARQAFLLKNALRHELRLEEEAKRQSEFFAEHDALTGLPNRLHFERKLGQLIGALEEGGAVAVLFVDLDGFKPVNDQHGHAAGDHVLRCVAERVRGVIRTSDLAARLGGDEFVIALPLAERPTTTIERLSAALRAVIGAPIEFKGRQLEVSASIGTAICPEDGSTAEELMHTADQSMYESKRRRQSAACGPGQQSSVASA